MSQPWRPVSQSTIPESELINMPFAFDDRGAPGELPMRSSGWWLQAQPIAPSAAISAAAKSPPKLLSAWTFNSPVTLAPNEDCIPRGHERIRLLMELGARMAVDARSPTVARHGITRLAA